MTIKKVNRPVYQTSDGELFTEENKASEHELLIQLNQWANSSGVCRGGEWSQDMVISQMMKDRRLLGSIFSPLTNIAPPPKVDIGGRRSGRTAKSTTSKQ